METATELLGESYQNEGPTHESEFENSRPITEDYKILTILVLNLGHFSGQDYPPYHGPEAGLGVAMGGDWDRRSRSGSIRSLRQPANWTASEGIEAVSTHCTGARPACPDVGSVSPLVLRGLCGTRRRLRSFATAAIRDV